MTDEPLARCDFCGTLFPPKQVVLYWVHADTLDDGQEVVTTGIYCNSPCAEWSDSRIGTSRG